MYAGTNVPCISSLSLRELYITVIMSLISLQSMMNLNFMGSVNVTQAVIGGMKARRRGRIVFVSSLAGLVGLFGFTSYSSTKYALRGLAEGLQMEVGCSPWPSTGIRSFVIVRDVNSGSLV